MCLSQPLGLRVISWKELETHSTEHHSDTLWVAIDGFAYDVSSWKSSHPGGAQVLEMVAGRDMTDQFPAYHPDSVRPKLKAFLVGVMESAEKVAATKIQAEHRKLYDQLMAEGKFETDYWFYYKTAAWIAVLFATAMYFTVVKQSVVLGSLFLALFWQQLAFVGHDIGHNSLTHERATDSFIGYFVTALLGISFSWWKSTHNVHHIVVNSVDYDPDIQHMPAFAVSQSFFKSLRSRFHDFVMEFDDTSRFMVSYQHITFFPLMMVAKWGFYIKAMVLLGFHDKVYLDRRAEIGTMLFYFGTFAALCLRMPSWPQSLAYLMLAHAFFAVLHLQITLSHWSRPTIEGLPDIGEDWVTTQVRGTMDWACPWWMDWFHGGLQFQVEHHLFPRLPRHNLRYASTLVKPMCARLGLPYHCPTFLGALYETLAVLHESAMAARKLVPRTPLLNTITLKKAADILPMPVHA